MNKQQISEVEKKIAAEKVAANKNVNDSIAYKYVRLSAILPVAGALILIASKIILK